LKFVRKALLPGVIAAGFLGFLGALGSTPTVSAAPGDVCLIEGPTLISEGETADYTAYVEGGVFTLADILNEIGGEQRILDIELTEATLDVNLDDQGGDSDITSVDTDGDGVTEDTAETDHVNAEAFDAGENVCGATDEESIDALADDIFDYLIDGVELGEICSVDSIETDDDGDATDCQTPSPGDADGTDAQYSNGFDDDDIDCGYVAFTADECVVSSAMLRAVARAMAEDVISGNELTICDTDEVAEEAALENDATEFVAFQIQDYVEDTCFDLGIINGVDDLFAMVDVTCDAAGTFDLSFAPEFRLEITLDDGIEIVERAGEAMSIEVRCGSDVDHATIEARPTTVEINPSIANVAHSLVWVTLFDEDDDNALAGDEVMFVTDRCAIESSTVDTEEEFEAAESVFRANNPLVPSTAAAVESSVYATTGPDGASRQQEEVNSFVVTGSAATNFAERTVAAVILHCDPVHAPGVTPGDAKITAFIEVGDDDQDEGDIDDDLSNNDDIAVSTTVKVVGPPAANGVTVTAAPSTLACGEKATITVDVKDSIGQPVSDHTFVEAVTNAGGVLAGTGAVAGQAGLVSPISSTVAETFGGKATFYLLTSTAHVGKYEVVVTTGGGGGVTGQLASGGNTTNLLGGLFTTAPISVQVTVECTVPSAAPAPNTQGPTTGQGITPPSTGDAGLVSSTGSSNWIIGAAVAAVAAIVVAGFALKPVREE